MKKRHLTLILLLAAILLWTACQSDKHMYRHNRSNCDCPTF